MISTTERENMLHALGLNQVGVTKPYRNRFVTDPAGEDGRCWEALVERGLAVKSKSIEMYAGAVMYAVTDRGMAELGVAPLDGLEPSERYA